jgi:hypothetical protein
MRTVSISPTTRIRVPSGLIVCSSMLISVSGFAQGDLTSLAAPAPTMKSLAQIEPHNRRPNYHELEPLPF